MVVFGCAFAQSVRFWWLLSFIQWKVKAFNNQLCSVLKNCHLKKFILSGGTKCIYICVLVFSFPVQLTKKTFVTARHMASGVYSLARTPEMPGMS